MRFSTKLKVKYKNKQLNRLKMKCNKYLAIYCPTVERIVWKEHITNHCTGFLLRCAP